MRAKRKYRYVASPYTTAGFSPSRATRNGGVISVPDDREERLAELTGLAAAGLPLFPERRPKYE